jgi:hydroxymethylpyrimidine/phosphomethylpyrimidine kinase
MAKGEGMETAVRSAKAWVSAAIAEADRFSVGRGHGPIHHFHKFY